jgi:CRP-like cAMP-binding protein
MSDVRLLEGDVLYRRGEPADAHFFVVSGEIRLEVEDYPPWHLGERSLVGTLDLTLDRPRARTATATRASFLLRLPALDWLSMLEDNFALTLRAIEGLSEGVNQARLELPGFALERDAPPARQTRTVPSGPLGLIDRVLLLRGIALFAGAEVQALSDLAEQAGEVTFAVGDVLVARGAPNDAMFLVLSGEVTATRAQGAPAERFGPGMLVYGSSAAAAKGLGYEAVATEPTRLLRIVREDFHDAIEEHFGLARSALKALAAERELLTNEKERRPRLSVRSAAPPLMPQ